MSVRLRKVEIEVLGIAPVLLLFQFITVPSISMHVIEVLYCYAIVLYSYFSYFVAVIAEVSLVVRRQESQVKKPPVTCSLC